MARKCKLCGAATDGKLKIRNGVICPDCAAKLPAGVRGSMAGFTDAQLGSVMDAVRPYTGNRRVWVKCEGLLVCEDRLVLNGMEYPLDNLSSVGLRFHPDGQGTEAGTAKGVISLVLELKQPRLLIEEMLSRKQTAVRYHISGMDVTYVFPDVLADAICCASLAVQSGASFIKEARLYFSAAEERRKQRERAEREKQEQARKRKQKEAENAAKRNMTPLESAMALFGVKRPFTKDELKKKRNQYLTAHRVHPDSGGSEDRFRQVQEAYDLLLKFASD